MVFNKIDLLDRQKIENIKQSYADSVTISAKEGLGLERLKRKISDLFV